MLRCLWVAVLVALAGLPATADGVVAHSADSRIELKLPDGFVLSPPPKVEEGQPPFEFYANDAAHGVFVLGWSGPRVGADFKAAAEESRKQMTDRPESTGVTELEEIQINGQRAYRWDVNFAQGGVTMRGVDTFIQTPTRWVGVIAAAPADGFDKLKPQLQSIAQGIRELAPPPVTFKSPDGRMQARLTVDWAAVEPPRPGYDLQAGNKERREYLLVGSTTKPSAPDLEAFAERIRGGIVASLSDVKVSELSALHVNGRAALRCEILGTRKDVRIGYVITAAETATRLVAIVGICDGEAFGERKFELAELAGVVYEAGDPATQASSKSPAAATPAPKSASAKPDPLAIAIALKSTDPAAAYAAFREITRTAPRTDNAQKALRELAAMEADPATTKRIFAGETKPYSTFTMAQNFQSAGKIDAARARYEQILKEYPDTLTATLAAKKLEEIAKEHP